MSKSVHFPPPREHELPDGGLAVSAHWIWGVRGATTVEEADKPLYRLLMDILAETSVPDLMPAHLAAGCEDLVDVRETVVDIDRGLVDLPGASYGMGYCLRVRDAIDEHRDRDPLQLALMGCSGSKHDVDGKVPARDLYARGYWTVKERYGSVVGDDWRILSAEHAVLHPDEEISYYERIPGDLQGVPVDSTARLPNGDPVRDRLDHWALSVYNGLVRWLDEVTQGVDPRDVALQVCVGEKYRDPLEERAVFERLEAVGDLTVTFPFQEEPEAAGGIGPQQSWMNSVVDEVAATDGGDEHGDHTQQEADR
jgi:hypothetical protein